MTQKRVNGSSCRARGADSGGSELRTRAALPTPEAGLYIGIARSTLKKWRTVGVGPPYVRVGSKILYMVEDLDDFLRAHRVQ